MSDTTPHERGLRKTGSFTTTQEGLPVPTNADAHSLSVGADGPIVLHDAHFVNQMAHFDRERVPERVVHAKGGGAFGEVVVSVPIGLLGRIGDQLEDGLCRCGDPP